MSHRTSLYYKYFSDFDLNAHPDKKEHKVCLLCWYEGIDLAIEVGFSSSTTKLSNHLLAVHKEEYLEVATATKELKKEKEKNESSLKRPVQGKLTTHIQSKVQQDEKYKQTFCRWIVNDILPLDNGESPHFKG